jgi:phage internal scaffolding protein
MGMLKLETLSYTDGRTKQSFKDQCDINKILKKAAKVGSLSHLERHGAQYGDFSDIGDLLQAQERLARGQEIFQELPSEIRREFSNDPGNFFEYVNDPANAGNLRELLPGLAEPGSQLPAVARSAESEANPALASTPAEESSTAPQAPSPSGSEVASSTT